MCVGRDSGPAARAATESRVLVHASHHVNIRCFAAVSGPYYPSGSRYGHQAFVPRHLHHSTDMRANVSFFGVFPENERKSKS